MCGSEAGTIKEKCMKRGIAAFAVFLSVSLLSACNSAGILGIEEKKSENAVESTVESTADRSDTSTAESVEEVVVEEEIPELKNGETWTVDGQWSMTILGASMTEERNEFSDLNPAVIYVVDYTYTNLGYEDTILDGLYITLDQEILDSTGAEGCFYPGLISNLPENVPVGATCRAQAWIGVENPGTFKINMSMYDVKMNQHQASFTVDPDAEHVEMAVPTVENDTAGTLGIGEPWTVDGQWALTITGVRPTDERNEFEYRNPAAVYVVDYEYTNLGYQEEASDMSGDSEDVGLFMTVDSQIVDSAGLMGYSYAGTVESSPEIIPVGETCHAQECIGVENPGDFRLTVSMYDTTGTKQRQTFLVKVG